MEQHAQKFDEDDAEQILRIAASLGSTSGDYDHSTHGRRSRAAATTTTKRSASGSDGSDGSNGGKRQKHSLQVL